MNAPTLRLPSLLGQLLVGLAIVVGCGQIISSQIARRSTFAASELRQDVMDRWGAPISQAAPSVRYVASGSVFTELLPLPLDAQEIHVTTKMNYRKRGLVYFSGFDFALDGRFRVTNPEPHDIEAAFVFPISLERNKVLLKDLRFEVDGERAPTFLGPGADALVWTGRIAAGETVRFAISYRGRGLDSFTYRLDPGLPVRDMTLAIDIAGGETYDYAPGVVPASATEVEADRVSLRWDFASLESGVPLGVTLPSERSHDRVIATMVRRAWAPFGILFAGLAALALREGRALRIYESALVAAIYGFFFVLLAYLAAFLPFALAYALALAAIGGLGLAHVGRVLGPRARRATVGLGTAALVVPTLAVLAEGYTGLIYTLEIFVGLVVAVELTSRGAVRERLDALLSSRATAALLLVAAGALALPGRAAAGEPAARERGEVTLPLAEVLELHRDRDRAREAEPPPPPVSASLVRAELRGRVEDDALAVDGTFEVHVLRADVWSRVRLLETGPSTVVSALPALEQGTLLLDGPYLSFVAREPGRYVFDLSYLEKAQRNGGRRRVDVGVMPAAVESLSVTVDDERHVLLEPRASAPGPIRLYPENSRFTLVWSARGGDAEEAVVASPAPRIDAVIPRGHASVVSTLEGRAVHRVLYELRFGGTEPLAVELPAGQRLEKLLVNGTPTPFALDEGGRRLEVEVTPEHAGQPEGRVELVLSSDLGRFNLSGQLRFELPSVSWPVHELDVTARLPEVFHYDRLDGSLEPAAEVPEARYGYAIPTPGKALHFHQFLIDGSAPHVNVSYAIDLSGHVFR